MGMLTLSACGGGGGSGGGPPGNRPPTVDAGSDQVVDEQTMVSLQGAATDSDGSIRSVSWRQVSGPTVTLDSPDAVRASFLAPSTAVPIILVFEIAATDDDGARASGRSSVTVQPVNLAPVANAGPDQVVDGEVSVTLDGSGSTDDDGSITAYAWTQLAGPGVTLTPPDGAVTRFTAPSAQLVTQVLEFQLSVTDNEATQSNDTIFVSINPTRLPSFSPIGNKALLEGQVLSVFVSASDPDGSPPILSADLGGLPAGSDARFTDRGDGSGTLVWNSRLGDAAGGPYSVRIRAADAHASNFFVEETIGLSVSPLLGTAVILEDDFSDGASANWTFVNDSGAASLWQETGGRLWQRNDTEAFMGAYALGSFAVRNDSLGFSNYLFSVDVFPESPTGLDVGILFRYQDANNYYRLSVNANNGYTRLEKAVNGSISTIAVNSRGYRPAEGFNLSVLVIADRIQTFLDGEPLFAAADDAHAVGGIGLYNQDDAAYDNVVVSDPPSQPIVGIRRPVAHSLTPGGPVDLSVSALVHNQPAGDFTVVVEQDGAACSPTTEAPAGIFSATCPAVAPGDHTVTALLVDNGTEVARDSSVSVGIGSLAVGGHRYDALGNSITEGVADNFSRDNLSTADPRVLGVRGWPGLLSDLLSAAGPAPSLVNNEGISGDTTQEHLDLRVDDILERNAGSDRALVLLGTNDSNPFPGVPIGAGCSGAGCNGTVKGNLLAIVDRLQAAGRDVVYLGLLPPAWGDNVSSSPYTDPLAGARSLRVQAINDVIAEEIVPTRSFVALGPDLFTCFLSPSVNRFSLFEDNLHPNGLGYAQVARLWYEAIAVGPPTPGLPCDLPYYSVEGLQPLDYKQNLLEVGDRYYVDESFTLAEIPPELAGSVWIMGANADADRSDSDFMAFDAGTDPVTVHVAYDPQGSPPSSATGLSPVTLSSPLRATGGLVTEFAVVAAQDVTGIFRLGGNRSGSPAAREMYLVIISAGS